MKFKVMTFNIKCDDTIAELEQQQLWTNRKENLVNEILTLSPDLIGMQEVMTHQQKYIAEKLNNEYGTIYQNRDDSAQNGEGSPIYFKKSMFELIDSKTFWLSETPDVPASSSWNSRWPRICTFALLKDKKTNQQFCFFNTHLDHKSDEARTNGVKLIISKINEIGLPAVLTGDFNSPRNSMAYQICSNN